MPLNKGCCTQTPFFLQPLFLHCSRPDSSSDPQQQPVSMSCLCTHRERASREGKRSPLLSCPGTAAPPKPEVRHGVLTQLRQGNTSRSLQQQGKAAGHPSLCTLRCICGWLLSRNSHACFSCFTFCLSGYENRRLGTA